MKFTQKLGFAIFMLLILTSFHCGSKDKDRATENNNALDRYVRYIDNMQTDPVDYIMGLFEKVDLVILCERGHPEITQYDLIYRIVSDSRFIDNVGHVFTEIGTSTRAEDIDRYLKPGIYSDIEAEDKLLFIYRNLVFHPVWNNINFFEFLKKLRQLNTSLSEERQIKLHFSDMPFDWEGMTEDKYRAFQDTLPQRDRIIAEQIINEFLEIQHSKQSRKKALVIMNYRHAFNDQFEKPGGKKGENVGRYLFEAFPERIANVMINSIRVMLGSTDQDVIMASIQDGKWDAAFAVAGNPSIGFDMESTPFGQDGFDFYPVRQEGLTYQDVFTGFVFYKPLKEHKYLFGIPALFENGFGDTAVERFLLTGMSIQEAQRIVEESRRPRESRYDNIVELEQDIQKWIDPIR